MIKAILLDMDGTLLNDQKRISPHTRQVLIDLQKIGVKVTLASGRPKKGMVDFSHELRLHEFNGLLVSSNGACVTDAKTNETLFEQPLSTKDATEILDHLTQFDVIPMINDEEYMYVNDVFNGMLHYNEQPFNIIQYEARGGHFKLREADRLAEIIDFPVYKILVAGEPEYLVEHSPAMLEPFQHKVNGMFTAKMFFEFTDHGIDKAKALTKVFQELEIDASDVIAFGDGHNDRSIIEFAGIGVAMENAVDDIKSIADEITLSNNHDGIAKVLSRYLTSSSN